MPSAVTETTTGTPVMSPPEETHDASLYRQTLAQEALLRRLSSTDNAKLVLVLKGSFLTRTWARTLNIEREAADLDFAALFPVDGDDCAQSIQYWTECCNVAVEDGCTVSLRSCERTRKDFPVPHSHGLFSILDVTIQNIDGSSVTVELHVDIGWGDPIFPCCEWMEYQCTESTTTSSKTVDVIQILTVPMEMQFAWKCAALFKRNKWHAPKSTSEAQTPPPKQLVQCYWAPKDLWDLIVLIRSEKLRQGVVVTCLNVAFYALASPELPLDARWMQRLTTETMGSSRQSAKRWLAYRAKQSTTTQPLLPEQVHQAVKEVANYCRTLLQGLPQIAADQQFDSFATLFGTNDINTKHEEVVCSLDDICSVWTCRKQPHAYLVVEGDMPPEMKHGARIRLGYHPDVFRVVSLRQARGWHPGTQSWPQPTDKTYRLVLDPPPSFAVCGGRVVLLMPETTGKEKSPAKQLSSNSNKGTVLEQTNSNTFSDPNVMDTKNTTAPSTTPSKSQISGVLPTAANVEREQFQARFIMKHFKKQTQNKLHVPSLNPPLRKGRRIVFVVSSSAPKVEEFRAFFARYGIGVAHVNPYGFRTAGKTIEKVATTLDPLARQLLAQTEPGLYWCKAVMWEQMLLLKYNDSDKNSPASFNDAPIDGERAVVKANLICWTWKEAASLEKQEYASMGLRHVGNSRDSPPSEGKDENCDENREQEDLMVTRFYSNSVEGFIDLSKRDKTRKEDVFGFDDIFVVKATSLSYHEKKVGGYKCSPRDANLSRFVSEYVHYKNRRDWGHLPSIAAEGDGLTNGQRRTISIGVGDGLDCAKFVSNTGYLHMGVAARLLPSFYSVVNDGAFFRSSISRREVNYWLPGLNAGIPFVKKKDEIHELTFLAHDFGHFMIPDLVFTGQHTPALRRVYIVSRMLSEATTLVFADMLFADALRRSGVQYDFTKRAIWPLFHATGVDPFPLQPDVEYTLSQFRKLLNANALYCLLGDDSGYLSLLDANGNGEEPDVLTQFKNKYMPFFVEDYRWTAHNYDSMVSRREEFQRWWKIVEPIRTALANAPGGSQIETVEEFAKAIGADTAHLSGRDLVERAFQRLFDTRIAPACRGRARAASPGIIRRNSLGRYMLGQMHLLARFPMIPDVRIYSDKLCKVMTRLLGQESVSVGECGAVRGLYDQFVDVLNDKGLVTPDDASIYKEVFPLFEPCYVNYDRGLDFYDELKDVQQRILGLDSSEDSSALTTGAATLATPAATLPFNGNLAVRRATTGTVTDGSPFVARLSGAAFVDMENVWKSVLLIPLKLRLRALLETVGVQFWDGPDGWFVKRPVAAVCAIGGLPVSVDQETTDTLSFGGAQHKLEDLVEEWRRGMGLASMPCYMNPGKKEPRDMWNVLCKHGHFSVGHTASLSFFIAGFSCGVENELNSQRDLVHMARITVARTAAQQRPPIVVQHPSLLPLVQHLKHFTEQSLPSTMPDDIQNKADWHEAVNLLWPTAKAQCAVITGTLRSFQKLMGAIDDEGKEAEFRSLLLLMNSTLHVLQPEMFRPEDSFGYKLPPHYNSGWSE